MIVIQDCMPMMADVVSGAIPRPVELQPGADVAAWARETPAIRKLCASWSMTPDSLTLTTAHAASSYGVPVLVIDGEVYGPGDMTPAGVTGAELVTTWARRFANLGKAEKAADLLLNFRTVTALRDVEAFIRAKLAELGQPDRASELEAILRAVWEQRASVSEHGAGYEVHLDGDLCAAIRAALGEA